MVLLETTGIAEPWSILDGLEDLRAATAPAVAAGVVCVVDAEAGARQLARHEEARAQVEAADRILLTKLDLASADAGRGAAPRCSRRATPTPSAPASRHGEEGAAALVPWLLDVRARRARHARHATRTRTRTASSTAVTFTDDAPLLAEPLLAVIERLGDALVRAKGFVNLAGEPAAGSSSARARARASRWASPGATTRARTELVLIGDGLDGDAIRRQLWACRAGR